MMWFSWLPPKYCRFKIWIPYLILLNCILKHLVIWWYFIFNRIIQNKSTMRMKALFRKNVPKKSDQRSSLYKWRTDTIHLLPTVSCNWQSIPTDHFPCNFSLVSSVSPLDFDKGMKPFWSPLGKAFSPLNHGLNVLKMSIVLSNVCSTP